jgi:hypothetical protein
MPRPEGCGNQTEGRQVKLRISLIAVACAAITAVLGVSSARAAVKAYCIDSQTVSLPGTAALDAFHQFQLDGYAVFGGAYTKSFLSGGAQPATLLDALSDLGTFTSAFPIAGGVFHPVLTGACPAPPPVAVPPGAGATPEAAAAVPRGEEGIFLCYSKFQVDPGVWTFSTAQTLLAGGGYWKPYAVLGPGSSTHMGYYSLVCNPGKVAASAPTAAVDGSGDVLAVPGLLDLLNVYPLLQ